MHRRQPYHPVQPLTGLRETRAAAVSYRALAPDGAGRSCGISTTHPLARHSATQFVIRGHDLPQLCGGNSSDHCSLIPAHSSHTFSAKERDTETGLSYFGSRYYSSDLSIWLSVDPMSDKYPSLSPYVYCADNPVKLVDPNGEDVFICGASSDSESDAKAAEKAFKYFAGSVKNLSLERDSKTGKLSATIKEGTQLSENEQKIYNAIIDKEVVVNLSVSNYNLHKNRETEFGVGFYGNKLGKNASGSGYAFAFTDQFVCLPVLEQNYFSSDIGGVITHEITESHYGGCASLTSGIAAEIATRDTPSYVAAHNNAVPCPPSAKTRTCQMFNISGEQYNALKLIGFKSKIFK